MFLGGPKDAKQIEWEEKNQRIMRRVKSAKALFRYLPQIIKEMFTESWMKNGVIEEDGEIDEPFLGLYQYLQRQMWDFYEIAKHTENPMCSFS